MTINDMLEQGIVLQGSITVRMYDHRTEDYVSVFDGTEDDGWRCAIDEPWADMPIAFIYSPYGSNGLFIELARES